MDDPCDQIGPFPNPPPPSASFQVSVNKKKKLTVTPDSHGTMHAIGESKRFYFQLTAEGVSAKFADPPATFSAPRGSAELTACWVADDQAVVVDVPAVKGKTTISVEVSVEVDDGRSREILKIDPKIINQPHQGGG